MIIPQGTSIVFLDTDTPWDNPHPHAINIMDVAGNVVYTTGKIDNTNSSTTKILSLGKYSVEDSKYKWMKANITVIPNQQKTTGSLIIGWILYSNKSSGK